MNVVQLRDRFEFHNDCSRDQEIQSMFAHHDIAVTNGERSLPLEIQTDMQQFDAQGFLIDGLKKPRPESAMHGNRSTNDSIRSLSIPNLFLIS